MILFRHLTTLLTLSWCIAHYGATVKFSLPAMSATGGWQELGHSWTHHTPVCSTNMKTSSAELLTMKWIQLLLVFSWGVQPPDGVTNHDPAFYITTPLVLEQRHCLQGSSVLFLVSHSTARISDRWLRAVRKVPELSKFLHKIDWMTLIVQEMQKSSKLLYLLVFFLHC